MCLQLFSHLGSMPDKDAVLLGVKRKVCKARLGQVQNKWQLAVQRNRPKSRIRTQAEAEPWTSPSKVQPEQGASRRHVSRVSSLGLPGHQWARNLKVKLAVRYRPGPFTQNKAGKDPGREQSLVICVPANHYVPSSSLHLQLNSGVGLGPATCFPAPDVLRSAFLSRSPLNSIPRRLSWWSATALDCLLPAL